MDRRLLVALDRLVDKHGINNVLEALAVVCKIGSGSYKIQHTPPKRRAMNKKYKIFVKNITVRLYIVIFNYLKSISKV